ncbi:hypothetical protein UlMin_012622 [Ulmus minor]
MERQVGEVHLPQKLPSKTIGSSLKKSAKSKTKSASVSKKKKEQLPESEDEATSSPYKMSRGKEKMPEYRDRFDQNPVSGFLVFRSTGKDLCYAGVAPLGTIRWQRTTRYVEKEKKIRKLCINKTKYSSDWMRILFYWKGFIYFIWFCEGSIVITTSRNREVLSVYIGAELYEVRKLDSTLKFCDMPHFKAGEVVTEALKNKGLFKEVKNNEMHLGICSRSNDVVEPLIKPQWYVNCISMAKEGPTWYVILEDDDLKEVGAYTDHWVVVTNKEEALAEARQDPDVLDSWFSSGLFPLSVLGWPDDTEDLKVARMIMVGIKLGGNIPFGKVYLHPMIQDEHGRKMSKSLGNVVDPLEVINGISLEGLHKRLEEGQKKDLANGIVECGADALCFSLVSYTAQSDKINLDIQRVMGYRQWCNKLWNAIRFSMSKLGDGYVPSSNVITPFFPFSCQWILSVLNKAIEDTNQFLEDYVFTDVARKAYYWWQYQLCNVFIELASERSFAQDTLWLCLDYGLQLLHPFMPFVTEELWQQLPYVRASFYFILKFKRKTIADELSEIRGKKLPYANNVHLLSFDYSDCLLWVYARVSYITYLLVQFSAQNPCYLFSSSALTGMRLYIGLDSLITLRNLNLDITRASELICLVHVANIYLNPTTKFAKRHPNHRSCLTSHCQDDESYEQQVISDQPCTDKDVIFCRRHPI